MKLKINNKSDFIQKFLIPISRINDLCSLKVESNSIHTLTRTIDSNFALYAFCEDVEVIDYTSDKSISFADIKKFIKAFECTEGETVELILNENNVEYKSPNVKFKFHLINDNMIKPPNYNLEKINSLQYNLAAKITSNTILSYIKSSTFITDSNKIYIRTEGDSLLGELCDKTRDNIDNFTTKLSDTFVGDHTTNDIILNFDIFRIISALRVNDIDFKMNTEKGFVAFDFQEDKYKLKYVATTMIS
jgi:hypothetical protein